MHFALPSIDLNCQRRLLNVADVTNVSKLPRLIRYCRVLQLFEEYVGRKRLTLDDVAANPAHPSLRPHALRGKFDGLHSVSINLSYRITLELLIQDQQIIPVNVGDHDAVY